VAEGVTVVRIHGRLDAATSARLESALLPAIGPGANRVVLDLQDVEYVSSGGLRVVLQLAKELRLLDGSAAIFGAGRSVRGVCQLTGVARVVPLFATEAEAVAAVRG
jgi:anti-sigma B factor antagonist